MRLLRGTKNNGAPAKAQTPWSKGNSGWDRVALIRFVSRHGTFLYYSGGMNVFWIHFGSTAPYMCGSGMRYGRASAEPPMGKGCKRSSPFNYEGITLGEVSLRQLCGMFGMVLSV